MSYDNTPNGDKKLRYDNLWDFDSNFGNRNGHYINGNGDERIDYEKFDITSHLIKYWINYGLNKRSY